MNIRINQRLLGFILLAFLFSCDKDFGDFNLNPDAVTQVDSKLLFSDAMVSTSAMDMEPRTNYFHAFMQYGFSGFWSGTNYNISDGIVQRYWNNFYQNPVKTIEFAINQLEGEPELVNTLSAARIWRVFLYQKLTDVYGDIPYSEAGKTFLTREFTPVFDSQQAIYTDLINELREAKAAFDTGARAVEGDQFYGGDVDKWTRLANSLLLRIGLRLLKVDATQANSLIQEAFNGGVMRNMGESPILLHNEDRPSGYNFNLGDQQFQLHKTLVDHMKTTGDPRLRIYGAIHMDQQIISTDTSTYEGYSFDGTDPAATVQVSFPIFRPATNPFFHFHYTQVELLLAEAAARGIIASDAADHFAKGIRAHMQSLSTFTTNPTIPEAEIDSYLANNPLPTGSLDEMVEAIATEFWVAGFLFDADEVWSNWRRTGYPDLTPNPNTLTGASDSPGRIPRKLPYPRRELDVNTTEVTRALSNYNGQNDFNQSARVWWDVE
ncbi:SusD/RagB family nutrient-binding outer membrane lipoprotein [Rapidithrix thailandica]|uniref:SusD/RagB family nutrient-binding outer membrane lipoprotein n=1 Tax=Rapidithrix thailandica TaxID=413964 RepID=A0AAW9S555_9BACT